MGKKKTLGGMEKKEFCGRLENIKYAGIHLIIEIWGGCHLTSLSKIKKILAKAAKVCQATLLKIDLHKFSPNGGVSGIAIIQESHISIHTWPEYKYAALDIFVCGTINPYKAIDVIKKEFKPKKLQVVEVKRGVL
ncbi:MAG: adenosylmethionine decarboxylase [Candidatus Omnitrophica bacterium]|nr:adenosylmethionine decarboxylase [Candidatus Omnitrophota bacterium]